MLKVLFELSTRGTYILPVKIINDVVSHSRTVMLLLLKHATTKQLFYRQLLFTITW